MNENRQGRGFRLSRGAWLSYRSSSSPALRPGGNPSPPAFSERPSSTKFASFNPACWDPTAYAGHELFRCSGGSSSKSACHLTKIFGFPKLTLDTIVSDIPEVPQLSDVGSHSPPGARRASSPPWPASAFGLGRPFRRLRGLGGARGAAPPAPGSGLLRSPSSLLQ